MWYFFLKGEISTLWTVCRVKKVFCLLWVLAITACSLDDVNTSKSNVIVKADSNLTTGEADSANPAMFSIVLSTKPLDTVSISINTSHFNISGISADPAENRVYLAETTIAFNNINWDKERKIYVKGKDDGINNGNTVYTVNIKPAVSNDPIYNGVGGTSLTITNLAIDLGRVIIADTGKLVTSENGLKARFDVTLSRKPSANVTLVVTSSNINEGTIEQPSIRVFLVEKWNEPITIVIVGVDDAVADGPVIYTVDMTTLSGDNLFADLSVQSVSITNQDNETVTSADAGVIVNPKAGLATSENGLADSFTVRLRSRPTLGTQVTINGVISDPLLATISPTSVTFNDSAGDWNTEKTFIITGLDDNPPVLQMLNPYTIDLNVNSLDPAYNTLAALSVSATNLDNDTVATPSVLVSPTEFTTTEQAGLNNTAQFTVTLATAPEPGEIVSLSAISGDTSEGTLSNSVIFTSQNWEIPKTFTLSATDDSIVDGDQIYDIALSSSSNLGNASAYQGLVISTVKVTNQDNEIPNVSIVFPNNNVVTSENGSSSTFTIVLDLEPSSDVSISAVSTNLNEGIVNPASVTFSATGANLWSQAKTFTVTGVDDAIVDGTQQYSILLSATSSSPYNNLLIPSIPASNTDNEVAAQTGINVISSPRLTTSENGTPVATFRVSLKTQPLGDVAITTTSSDPSEGLVTPNTVTFSTVNWATPQIFTITGQDDFIVDGPISYTITLSSMSIDPTYDAIIPSPVNVVNIDNDIVSSLILDLFVEPSPTSITNSADSGIGAITLNTSGYASTPTIDQNPSPLIEAIVDQIVVVTLYNDSASPHSFEALPALGATRIISGGSATLNFKYRTVGIYRYGSSELGPRGIGFFGAVVVKPTTTTNAVWPNGPTYTQERNWVLSDIDTQWLLDSQINITNINTAIYTPEYFLINGLNGHAAINDVNTRILGAVGEVFLIRILNAGQYDQSLHFHGNHFAIISQNGVNNMTLTDANIATAPTVSTINVKRNASAMILYTLKTPGTYPVHSHTPNMQTGNGVYLNGIATSITVN